MLDEHFRIMGRTKWYEGVEEMHKDLGAYLVQYNTKRPHQSRMMEGRTPLAQLKRGKPKAKAAKLVPARNGRCQVITITAH